MRSTMNHSQVLSRVFVGSYPASTEDIDYLKRDFGVTAVLNLQTDDDFDYWNIDWDRLQEQHPGSSLEHLSMGMSQDYEVAIEEGATMVRVGSALLR